MDMVWITVASRIHPQTNEGVTVSKDQIDRTVVDLFQESITPVMITSHLVNSVDRQADAKNPERGGSRNRYLSRDDQGQYRLYKAGDRNSDAWEKTGPTCPSTENVPSQFHDLISWYQSEYLNS